MKIWFLLLVLISTSAQAGVNFTIDKEIYENLSAVQQQAIAYKVTDLNDFFRKDVLPLVPKSLEMDVTINFTNKEGRDGLFVPGAQDHKHKIYIHLMKLNSNGINALLAHEFFHAVHFELNPDVDPWIREGMAQLFEYLVTNELNGINLQAAIANPKTPLIGEYDIDDANPAQYGHDLLYFYYLYNHCGRNNFFWKLAAGAGEQKDEGMIDTVLKNSHSRADECRDFKTSAVSFETAKLHNQMQHLKEDEKEKYFVAPVNLTPKLLNVDSTKELNDELNSLPLYSSVRLKLDQWKTLKGQCQDCQVNYVRRSFPYEVEQSAPNDKNMKSYDVIIVKTGGSAVLTEVSSKNTRK